jgi:FixJ family two-component response regulator
MGQQAIHVVVVDDDDSFARAIGRLLRAAGIESSYYRSAEAFLQDESRALADCLLVDIHLDGMSGLDLRRHLTAHGRATPVIFVTGDDASEVREEALQIGCSAYFHKPISGRLLLEAIARAIDLSRFG